MREQILTIGEFVKSILLLLGLSFCLYSFESLSFYQTANYAIFEQDDQFEVESYLNHMSSYGIFNYQAIPDDILYKRLDKKIQNIALELYQAYLKEFKLSEINFPRPFIILSTSEMLANIAYIENPESNTAIASNLIIMSSRYAYTDELIYAQLAHEMAHYYHRHLNKRSKTIRAYYLENHRDINIDNNFGANIPNNVQLRNDLNTIQKVGYSLYGPKNSRKMLERIEIAPYDGIKAHIMNRYPELFQIPKDANNNCIPLLQHLESMIQPNVELSKEMIAKTNTLEAKCDLTKDKAWDFLFKEILPTEIINYININPLNFLNAPNPVIVRAAEANLYVELPITSMIGLIYQQRLEIKKLVTSINWKDLQLYTVESQADVTSFQVLQQLGKADSQLSILNIELPKSTKCVEKILDETKDINPLNAISNIDAHEDACYRAYRTYKMLEHFDQSFKSKTPKDLFPLQVFN